MAYGYAKEIQNRIGAASDGTIFIVSDFSDVADSETIRRNLNRLVEIPLFFDGSDWGWRLRVQKAGWNICSSDRLSEGLIE